MGFRLSKIYTRTGDKGETGLGDGRRVPKDHPRIEAIGANALAGVKDNLRIVHEHAWAKRPLNQLEALANPPMADIVARRFAGAGSGPTGLRGLRSGSPVVARAARLFGVVASQ